MKRKFWALKILGMILLGALVILGLGFVVMGLWNAILPAVLGVKTITFVQALGIFVLCKILFGGFRGRGGGGRWGEKKREWRMKMREKWDQMSPEQRQQWKQQMRDRCRSWGRHPHPAETMTADHPNPTE